MKCRVCRGKVVALLIIITFFYPLLAPTPHRIDEAHARLIRKGMTLWEVEAIFGVPPGDYNFATLGRDSIEVRQLVMNAHRSACIKPCNEFLEKLLNLAPESSDRKELIQREVKRIKEAEAIFDDTFRTMESWTSQRGSFDVFFDKNGLASLVFRPGAVRTESLWQWLKRTILQTNG